MAKKDSTEEAGSAAAAFEAEIRANARPMLTDEEVEAEGIKRSILDCKWAAAKCREDAAAQIAQAEEYEAQAAEFAAKSEGA